MSWERAGGDGEEGGRDGESEGRPGRAGLRRGPWCGRSPGERRRGPSPLSPTSPQPCEPPGEAAPHTGQGLGEGRGVPLKGRGQAR